MWVIMLRTLFIEQNAYQFISATEYIFPILLVPVCSFILSEKTEIELALVSGTRTSKLFFSKLIPMIAFTILPTAIFTLLNNSKVYSKLIPELLTIKEIPEHVPENFKLLIIISISVTVIFYFAVYSLIRVITRSCYIPLLVCFGVSVGISNFSAVIRANILSLKWSIADPLINTYFIGNTVPNAYASKFEELSNLTNAWTYNRLLYLCVSGVIFFITYLILRREKLHQGIGE